jgi:hypothetical protein
MRLVHALVGSFVWAALVAIGVLGVAALAYAVAP